MRYATWIIKFPVDETLGGTTPLSTHGIFHVGQRLVAGYVDDAEDVGLLTDWNINIIPAQAFLGLAKTVNPLVTMVNGLLVAPEPVRPDQPS